MKQDFKKGDWVYYDIPNQKYQGAVGYLLEVGMSSGLVRFIKRGDGQPVDAEIRVLFEKLMKADPNPTMSKEQFDILMDLALAAKDYDWCKELVDSYKSERKAVRSIG